MNAVREKAGGKKRFMRELGELFTVRDVWILNMKNPLKKPHQNGRAHFSGSRKPFPLAKCGLEKKALRTNQTNEGR